MKQVTVIMAPVKIPAAKRDEEGAYLCPITGCTWDTLCRTSYNRHYDVHHSKTFRYICPHCGGGQHRRYLHNLHIKNNCQGTEEANLAGRGRKLTIASARQYRAVHRAAQEEEVQGLEETLEVVEREKEQLKEKLKAEKKEREAERNKLQAEKKELKAERNEMQAQNKELETERNELRDIVDKLKEMVKKMEAQEPILTVNEVVDQVMDKGVGLVAGIEVEGPVLGTVEHQLVDEEPELVVQQVFEEPDMVLKVALQSRGQTASPLMESRRTEVEEPVLHPVIQGLHPVSLQPVLQSPPQVSQSVPSLEANLVVEELVLLLSDDEEEGPPGSLLLHPVPLVSSPTHLRRSGRVPAEEKKKKELSRVLATMDPAVLGLVVKQTENMERGLFAGRDIGSGEWVVEYDGILLSQGEADKRTMEKDGFTAYFFWFKEDGRWFCIDASQDSPHPGRLINHSRAAYNLVAKKVPGELRVAFRSSRDISAGEELFFDYNDRRKEVLSSVLWMDK